MSASSRSTLKSALKVGNAQMEVMYALARVDAVGAPLDTIFPADFMEEFHQRKDQPGVHNLYKIPAEDPLGRGAHCEYRNRSTGLTQFLRGRPHHPGR